MSPVRLVIELEDGEPVRGWLALPDGEREPFAGLLELLAVFDSLRASHGPARQRDADGPSGGSRTV
ncbi:MAG: hypothetical protein ACYDHH_31800 [Solirubrobacteraceae bacterium]